MNTDKLRKDLRLIRIAIILISLLEIGFFFILPVYDRALIDRLIINYHLNLAVIAIHGIVAGICIWYNWKKLPLPKKKKKDNTYMILFLGLIGMWLWLPNKRL